MAEILSFNDNIPGFHYQLARRTVLGRAPECDLHIFDRNASRQHAEIFMADDKYFVADLGSTNGTLLNDQPLLGRTPLEPYDTIRIGRELFIFEPGLSVILGPAPSALIIENLTEDLGGLVSAQCVQAAAEVASEDMPALMFLSARLLECGTPEEIESTLLSFLGEHFGITFMATLWSTPQPGRRLISLVNSHDDKRLFLGRTPFDRVIKDREALLWPSTVSDLTFHDRERQVVRRDHPVLIGPLRVDHETAGLMYLENRNRRFTERDLKAFAAMLVAVSPAVAAMAGIRTSGTLRKSDLPHTSELMDLVLAATDLKVKLVFSLAAQAAAGQDPIMIQGEPGTAKSSLAEYIHSVSPRKGGRLVPVNLANIPEANLEAVLFGVVHTPGHDRQIGLVELADGGTLFLHHVELLPLKVQKLVLIMLEEGLFHPLGAHQAREVNLRVISSTSIDLDALVDTGRFRRDLYLRLAGLSIATPPLRQIKGDLENFLKIYLGRTAKEMGITFQGVDPGVVECLRAYSWPGNLTELKLEAGLMLIFNQDGRVTLEDLPAHLRLAAEAFTGDPGETPPPLILEAERHQLAAALSRCQGDLERVADLLGRPPEDVIVKMRKLGLDPINYQGPVIRPRLKKSEKTATAL